MKVSGTSMLPTISEGDVVTVSYDNSYSIGDVLVFIYKGNLLIHRLVKIENNRFFCKGDNSFRLEDLTIERIIGKVVLLNYSKLPSFSNNNIALSYLVNREFRKCGYLTEKTKKSGIYRFYSQLLWNTKDSTLKFRFKKTIPDKLLQNWLVSEFDKSCVVGRLQKKDNIGFIQTMRDFCSLNSLMSYFSILGGINSADSHTELNNFLACGIINNYIEVS